MKEEKIGGSFLIKETDFQDVFIIEDFDSTAQQMIDATRDFVEKEIYPNIRQLENNNYDLVKNIMKKAGDLGLLGLNIPEEYGGFGMGFNLSMFICGEMSSYSGSVATAYGAHTGIGTYPILYYGSEELKKIFLPKIASGEWISCYNLTEPNAGSDANSGTTKAVLTENKKQFEISGQKIWISNAGFAEVFIVFARIENDKNITGFVLNKSGAKGITLGEEEKKLGLNSSSTRQVFFDKTKISINQMLGERNGGFKIAMNSLNVGRIKLCAATTAAAEKVLNISIEYALQRKQFKNEIINYGAIKEKLANMATLVYCSNAALYRAGNDIEIKIQQLINKGENKTNAKLKGLLSYAVECAIMKVNGSEVIKFVSDEAIQIHGGMGYSADSLVEPAYRDARISRIYEGTNEINRMLIVEMMLKKAIKKELNIFKAIKKLQRELPLITLGINKKFSKSKLSDEKVAVNKLKKLSLLMLGISVSKYKAKLVKEQELLMRIADLIIETYICESALLKTEKKIKNNGFNNSKTEINMTRNHIHYSLNLCRNSAEEIIMATSNGIKNRYLISVSKKLTYPLQLDIKETRRRISEKLQSDKKYNFSI
ncbi:MAG: acyl-CoA dehydrogenase [Flavobacteriales bacterium]|jgi:alkylation response protein AidB-like acyl-CoA dehydrogenase|nr:acyl-CoA dehydrogenase [Flavobacteriales bacterium]|tara:strand:+ start:4331 stop:6127 length:1797 start_codon:yes stop_codon:yes gene_type:complete